MARTRRRRGLDIWQGPDGQWYWHLVARNGKIIAVGGEGFRRKASALRGVQSTYRELALAIWR